MFYLENKNWFGSKHPIVSQQFPFVTKTLQTVASSFPKQKINPTFLQTLIILFSDILTRHATTSTYSKSQRRTSKN